MELLPPSGDVALRYSFTVAKLAVREGIDGAIAFLGVVATTGEQTFHKAAIFSDFLPNRRSQIPLDPPNGSASQGSATLDSAA